MPLRDIGEFQVWIDRENPSRAARSAARTFIAELGDVPWRAPSTPIPGLSDQPTYELRIATIDVPGEPPVAIWYLHVYATDDVDLIAVSNR